MFSDHICKLKGSDYIDKEKKYIVYSHTNCNNQKKYIGITCLKPEDRWKNGDGYVHNKKFYKDILKLGWHKFEHKIEASNLSYLKARELETKLIKKFDTVSNGYNNNYSNISDGIGLDIYDFKIIGNKEYTYKNTSISFSKVPNEFIQNNLEENYGLNRIFIIVFILIDIHKTYENISFISIGQVLSICGYKLQKTKPKIFYEVIKSLLFLKENYYIETDFDVDNVGYNDILEIRIISENFFPNENFTKLYWNTFNNIISLQDTPLKEHLVLVFLYVLSRIGCRDNKMSSVNTQNCDFNPEAFWGSIENISITLKMSRNTVGKCLQCLTQQKQDYVPPLIKVPMSQFIIQDNKMIKSMPSIYVMNKENYEIEVELVKQKLLNNVKKEN